MDHKFRLEGQEVTVTVLQTAKTVWQAFGDFDGANVTVKGTSAQNALDRWRKVALRQGD